ncbi:PTS sugar transporter subunit IIA [Leeia sp. TBRC 13508]|uniref:PTS sugar transporter subunit IIA n=1 Tax=Leeia speluncae TaxID=2884804 RepID=A0ABS8D678_9NEIS|nr:PTS sugar transporter subunit IIA [Leeia speluncae]MCB6183695.1 PTS sugar transporter subunit IIA [Leeia speluncae]
MSFIRKILTVDHVFLDLDVSSKKRIFEQVGLVAENDFQIARSKVYDALFDREKLGSTGLGQGVAIPHGRIKGLKEAAGFFVRLKEPIPYDAPDGKPVRLLFVLLVPDHASELHLQILGELAELFCSRTLREQLLIETDPAKLFELLGGQV